MRLQSSYPTEFYVSDLGYLVIKQECCDCGRYTQFLISPEQTTILSNLMPEIIKQQKERWHGLFVLDDEDPDETV